MNISEFFPIWSQLSAEDQQALIDSATTTTIKAGTVLHNGIDSCQGLYLVQSGQLRAYILSEKGREITLYRLFPWDICLFSASCIMRSIQFSITIEAEKDCVVTNVSAGVYQQVMERSAVLANYTNQIMASRFSEVMWLIEQVMWSSFDNRLASFLVNESRIEEARVLSITHDKIANHLGTAREVVTRMLKYFQSEGLVRLNRGTIELLDIEARYPEE